MATLGLVVSAVSKFVRKTPNLAGYGFQQVRNKWANNLMLRDYKRRLVAKEHAPMRVRLIAMKRNNILPVELRELVCKDMEAIPKNAAMNRLTCRCVLTSRPRGVLYRWRLSRIVFRHLADYNQLAGVQRAMW